MTTKREKKKSVCRQIIIIYEVLDHTNMEYKWGRLKINWQQIFLDYTKLKAIL